MTLMTMVALGLACWFVRTLFILIVPADRLPRRARRSLTCLAPATMAALVAVQGDTAAHDGTALVIGTVLLCAVGALLLARRPRGLLLTVGLGAAAALVLDLVLVV